MYRWIATAGLALAATLHMTAASHATVTYQVSDTRVVNCSNPDSGHGLWTNNLVSTGHCPNYFSIDPTVSLFTLFNDDGNPDNWTASLTAVARNPGNILATINIAFTGFKETHTAYKKEGGADWTPMADNPDIDFFSGATGTIVIAGLTYNLATDPFEGDTHFQFGVGANAKTPDEFGASSWLRVAGPTRNHWGNDHWDLNLTFADEPPGLELPEPHAALLFVFGLAGLGVTARRRRSAAARES